MRLEEPGGARDVAAFYESHPYPPPLDDLDAYGRLWDDRRRLADSHLFWPREPYREDRSVLVAGCGTSQAAHYAVRWPHARVVGIDVSAKSISFSEELKHKYGLGNLEIRELSVERATELEETFDHVVCTGVLHHLADPDVGLRALHAVLAPAGALHMMVYAPYGRAGIYLLQDYCRRLAIGWSADAVDGLAATLKALPADHPLVPLLRSSPDFASKTGLADALLHPCDRSYSVPQFLDFIERADLAFGRWIRQAPYLPSCGAIASTPHAPRLRSLPPDEQAAALELFRGTMSRHSAVVYRRDQPLQSRIDFEGEEWVDYVPIWLVDTVIVRERLPAGASAVLINRNHTFNDLYLPIDAGQESLLSAIDGKRSISEISRIANLNAGKLNAGKLNAGKLNPPQASKRSLAQASTRSPVGAFFEQLWQWDQVVFDASKSR